MKFKNSARFSTSAVAPGMMRVLCGVLGDGRVVWRKGTHRMTSPCKVHEERRFGRRSLFQTQNRLYDYPHHWQLLKTGLGDSSTVISFDYNAVISRTSQTIDLLRTERGLQCCYCANAVEIVFVAAVCSRRRGILSLACRKDVAVEMLLLSMRRCCRWVVS